MTKKFFITGVKNLDNSRCFQSIVISHNDEENYCIKQYIYDTADDEPEEEELVAFVEEHSLSGIKICLLRTGETTVFLDWYASMYDIILCYDYLNKVMELYPEATITYADDQDRNTCTSVDLSDVASTNIFIERAALMYELIQSEDEVIRIPGLRVKYHLFPTEFRKFTEQMQPKEQVLKLYADMLALQWGEEPAPKSYMLRWNPAISNIKLKDFEKFLKNFEQNPYISWSIWDWQDVRDGDIVYLLRVGEGNTGIILRGEIDGEPYVDEDWSGKGRLVHYVDIHVLDIVPPDKAAIITLKELNASFPITDWGEGHSGTLIEPKIAQIIEETFNHNLIEERDQFNRGKNSLARS